MLSKKVHDKFVYNRRKNLLSTIFSDLLHEGASVLDIGCGDGKIDYLITQKKDVDILGVDVLVRDKTYVPVQEFDGENLPFEDDSFDTVLFIDVLHHIDNPAAILKEAKRVARKNIIIKDHLQKGAFAFTTLKLMDYVGNAHYGVNLNYNYLKQENWNELFKEVGIEPPSLEEWIDKLNLYPFPFNLIFDRKLHFVARFSFDKGVT